MSIRGLLSIWVSDVNKVRDKLNNIWLEVVRSDINPLVKDKIKVNIDIIFRLLGKGRVNNERHHTEDSRETNER